MANKPAKKATPKPAKKADIRSLVLNAISSGRNQDKLDAAMEIVHKNDSSYAGKVRNIIKSGLQKSRRLEQILTL